MTRNSMVRLVASTIWSREDSFFPLHGVNTALLSFYKRGNMLVLKGAVFFIDLSNCRQY